MRVVIVYVLAEVQVSELIESLTIFATSDFAGVCAGTSISASAAPPDGIAEIRRPPSFGYSFGTIL
jgi:hypothetical protein